MGGKMVDPNGVAERACSSWMLENVVTGDVHRLRLGRTTIGSHPRSDIRSCRPYVETHHAQIDVSVDDDTVTVRDLNTTEGVFLNSTRVQNEEAILEDGDSVGFGVHNFFAATAVLEIPVYSVKYQPMKVAVVDIKPILKTSSTSFMDNTDIKPAPKPTPRKVARLPSTITSDFVIVIDDDDEEDNGTTTATKSCMLQNSTGNDGRVVPDSLYTINKAEIRAALPNSVPSAEHNGMPLVHMPRINEMKQEIVCEIAERVTDIFGEADETIFNHMKNNHPYVYNELCKQANRSPITEQPRLFDKDIVVLDGDVEYYTLKESQPRELQSPPRELQSPPRELQSPPIELLSPPIELLSPPIELQSPPLELQSPPRELQRELQRTPPTCAPPSPQIIKSIPLLSSKKSKTPEPVIADKLGEKAKPVQRKRKSSDSEVISSKKLKRPESTEAQNKAKPKPTSSLQTLKNTKDSPMPEKVKKEKRKHRHHSSSSERESKSKKHDAPEHSSGQNKTKKLHDDNDSEQRQSPALKIIKKQKSHQSNTKKPDLNNEAVKIAKQDNHGSKKNTASRQKDHDDQQDKAKSPRSVAKSKGSVKRQKEKEIETFMELFGNGDEQNAPNARMVEKSKRKSDDRCHDSNIKTFGTKNEHMEAKNQNEHEIGNCLKNKAAKSESTEAHLLKITPVNRPMPVIIEAPYLPKWKGKLRGVSAVQPKTDKKALKKREFTKLREQRKERLQKLAAPERRTDNEPSTPLKRHASEDGDDAHPIKIRLTRVESSESNSSTSKYENNTYRSTLMNWLPAENPQPTDQRTSDTTASNKTNNAVETPSSPKAIAANFYLPTETCASPKKSTARPSPPQTAYANTETDTVTEKPFVRTAAAKISYRTVNKVTFASQERNYTQNRALDEKLETLSKQRQLQINAQKSPELNNGDKQQKPKLSNISRLISWANSTLPGQLTSTCEAVMPMRDSDMWNIRKNFLTKLKENKNFDPFRVMRTHFTKLTDRLNLTVLCDDAKEHQLAELDKFSVAQVCFTQGMHTYAFVADKEPIKGGKPAVLKLEFVLGKVLTESHVLANKHFVVCPALSDIRYELSSMHNKE